MTMLELNELTRAEWLISLWPLWLILIGVAAGLIARWLAS